MAEVVIKKLTRMFGQTHAVDDLSLTIGDGEFLTLLGPSGCGKSTVLNAIAGLDRPTKGTIEIGGEVVTSVPRGVFREPERRDIGMVFQSYALWPHMTVAANLTLPLRLRGVPRTERRERVVGVLELVELGEAAERYPHELSGGQQQRVALARALVYRPSVLLLDEPLSNLDAKLRDRARVWLRDLQKRLGITSVYVTHDQSEALAISDRIAVMERGRLLQTAAPEEIYERPKDARVADFVGASNLIPGRVTEADRQGVTVGLSQHRELRALGNGLQVGVPVIVAVRPERIELADQPGENRFEAEVVSHAYLGSSYLTELSVGDLSVRALFDYAPGAGRIRIHLPKEACRVLSQSSEFDRPPS